MSTIPDDHQPDHAQLAALRAAYPAWQIGSGETGLGVVTAERREGSAIRYIVARTPDDLAGKLATAEQATP